MSYNFPHDPDMDAPAPWQRQDDEPNLHYAWFHVYLLLGPGRSMRAAYNNFQASKSSAVAKSNQDSPQNLAPSKSWRDAASLWKWVERASAWDENRRAEEEVARAEWNRKMGLRAESSVEELLSRADDARKISSQMLAWPLHQATTTNDGQTVVIEPARWTFDTAVRASLAYLKATETAFKIFVELDAQRTREAERHQDEIADALMNRALNALEAVEKESDASSPTQRRARENLVLDALEASLLVKAQRGTPGAVDRILRVSQRRATLNGLNQPFDPSREEMPKKRRDLSAFSQAELDLMEEMFFKEEEEAEARPYSEN